MSELLILFLGVAAAGSGYLIARQGVYQVQEWKTARNTKALLAWEHPIGGFNDMMTRHEAASIIGIDEQAMTRRKLAERYKRVMLLNHPDRGGSPYLAMKINEARRVLMRYCR